MSPNQEENILRGSADNPLGREDQGFQAMRKGTQKRLLGNVKSVRQWLTMEAQAYENMAGRAQALRHHRCDLVEIYGGFANISVEGIKRGLRVVQPVDHVHGIGLEKRADHEMLRTCLLRLKPFLTVWEPRCDPWSNIQHLNYTPEELEKLQQAELFHVREICKTIKQLLPFDCHFLIENPWGTKFWQSKELEEIQQLPNVSLGKGAMLRGRSGHLLKKETGWCSDLPEVLAKIIKPCSGDHPHDECLGTNAKRGQIYTKKLARAIIEGLCCALRDRGDERFLCHPELCIDITTGTHVTGDAVAWTTAWNAVNFSFSTSSSTATSWYTDVVRDVEQWRPMLKEAEKRLHNKVATAATVKADTAFFEQIRQLAPWRLALVQIARTPKARRLPLNIMMEQPVTHRAAVLLHHNGQISIETEVVADISRAPGSKFESPVAYGIFIYGEASKTSYDDEENKQPETSSHAEPLQPEEMLGPHQPGSQDITFPDVSQSTLPQWMRSVLKRLHVNLGHPSNQALVRHLAQAGASGPALHGAKNMRCAVCIRTRLPLQPRPTKVFQARRFGDRLMLDIVYVRDQTKQQHMFLNQLDDATTYQCLSLLHSRSEQEVTHCLVHGWFKYFGFPDEMLLDAEGAMKGWHFEELCAQAGIRVRHVPSEAHYQLGKAERHGQAAKWIMKRLINQYAVINAEEMQVVANLASFSKNTLARRAGASPCQWVFGRTPKIPGALLSEPDAIEAKQVIDDSAKYREIEAMRHTAMQEFLTFEHNEALRRAILRKSRPWRGPLEVGQRIAYFREKSQLDGEGSAEGYRQGMIIGLDPGPTGSVWVRTNRGRTVQVSREQVRGIEGEELWTPSLDDLRMLRSAEDDLARQHAPAFDHQGQQPQPQQDRLILDAAGHVMPPEEGIPAPLMALMPPPAPEPPEEPVPVQPLSLNEREPQQEGEPQPEQPDLPLLPPILEDEQAPQQQQAPRQVTFEEPQTSQASWFLDPDGRPTAVVENATNFQDPSSGSYDPNTYKYRTSWSYQDGQWKKLEDRVDMSQLNDPKEAVPESPVERLVMSFSRDLARGRRPSIESAAGVKRHPTEEDRGVKRSADDASLVAEGVGDTSASKPKKEEPAAASTEEPMSTLLLYCKNCGCQQRDRHRHECVRCNTSDMVTDPRRVDSWFDEVEEFEALEQLRDQVSYNTKQKAWQDYPLANVDEIKLPETEMLDEIHDTEAYILDIGQACQGPPPQISDDQTVWSVAAKEAGEWQWVQLFDSIDVAHNTIEETFGLNTPEKILSIQHQGSRQTTKPSEKVKLRRREKDWLRRHGRHCVQVPGWDGSPPEVQPLFQRDDFAQCYQTYVQDVRDNKATSLDPVVYQDALDVSVLTVSSSSPMCPSVFHVAPLEMQQTITGPDSASEEEDEGEADGRALRQALKRETPWRTIPDEDIPGFIKAMTEEWDEWQKWSSCKPTWPKPNEIEPHLILKSRVCYKWKPKDGGKWFKPKARIVVLGYQDPHLPLLSRDAPVLAKTTLVLIIQWAACFDIILLNGDCKSAFLQGEPDTERPVRIYMRPPTDDIAKAAIPEWNDPLLLYQLTAPVYGQANAPRRWFLHVLHTLMAKGWRQHSLDPCCFLQTDNNMVVAVLGVHVDDIIIGCMPGYEHLLEAVKSSFVWGSEWEKGDFVFVGRRITRQDDGGYTMDQVHYVADISKTKIDKNLDEKLADHPELVTEFRSGIGSLQWMAGTTRGDLAADVSLLQKPPKELTVGDLKEVNRVLKYVKATANTFVKIHAVEIGAAVFIAYGDSGWANAPGNKSQGGLVVTLTDKKALQEPRPASLLEWKSYRHQRVLRSTLAAEAASLDRSADTANFMACVFSEMVYPDYRASSGVPMFEVIPVTDARSLWDAVHRLSTTFTEKRVEIDVAGLRQTCRNLKWVPTEKQWADALTKRCAKLRDEFRKWSMNPMVTLTEARSAEDGADNAAWRRSPECTTNIES